MKRAAAALLLALAACGGAPVANNGTGSSAPANAVLPAPVPDERPVINNSVEATTAPAPAPATGGIGADPEPDRGNGPRDRFIVCPGNPRCPPEGSQPKGRQPN